MTGAAEWQGRVGETWAALAAQTDRSFAPVTAALLDDPVCRAFGHALDIGCGAGEFACALSAAHPTARVTGVDISEDLLSVARARCSQARFALADAAAYRAVPHPDLLVSRHGVMFFPDPVTAFTSLRAQAAPGAHMRFSCFRARRDNAWAGALADVVEVMPPPDDDRAPGPFAFGEAAYVETILSDAGWQDIALAPLDYAMVAGVGARDAAVAEAVDYFRRIGPAASPLATLQGADQQRALARLAALAEDCYSAGGVALPAAAWIVTARAPI